MRTTEEKVEALSHDFLERDGDKYVKIRRTNRLGWESVRPIKTIYDEHITGAKNTEELVEKAYKMATNMLVAMDIPNRVKIELEPKESYTDGTSVHVATNVFDDARLDRNEKLDTFIGFAVHEGCHLLYTRFGEMSKVKDKITSALLNIIEDERIERECGEAKPGLGKFLAAAKDYAFVKSQQDIEWGEIPDHLRLINAIAGYIRFPRALVPADVEKFADELLAVKDILTPYPDSTESARLAAEKIRELIQKYLNEQQQEQQQQGENGGEAGGEGQESGDAAGEGKKLAQAIKEMAEALEKMSESVSEASDSSDVSRDLDEKQLQLAMGYAERGEYSDKTIVLPSDEDREKYEEAYDNVRQYIPAVAKSLQQESTELKFVVAGMKNGRLDTNRLAEAYQNVENVYKLQGEVKSTRLSVAILIDESGSMGGSWRRDSKCVKAREAAVLLNEALSRLPNVDLYIYGHTDDWSSKYGDAVELRVYREGKNAKRYALGSTAARSGNLDSIAIREVAARVRKRTQERCLFFVITDGAPNEGTEEVKKAVKDVTRKGFDVLAISIESHYSPEEMYDHYITLSDLSKLPIDLGKLVKGMIRKNTKRMIQY